MALKTAVFLVPLFVLYVTAQIDNCEVVEIKKTSARVKWCDDNQRSSSVTIEAKPVGLVVGGSDGPREVTGCETDLQNLCLLQKYQVKLSGPTLNKTCEFTTDITDHDNIPNVGRDELQVTELTSTSVKLTWKHARCFRRDNTMYYKIQTDFDGSSSVEYYEAWGDQSLNETHEQYEKTGLNPRTWYRFAISTCKKSVNRCSWGHVIQERNTTSAEPSPPSLKVESVTAKSIQVSWSKPLQPNGPVDGYVVYFDNRKQIVTRTMTWKEEGLNSSTYYEVSVAAFNMDGGNRLYSEKASIVIKTSERGYNPPRNLTVTSMDSSHFEVAWSPPDLLGDDQLVEYVVYLNGELVANKSSNSTTFRKDDLKPSQQPSQYSVEVFASYGQWNVLSDPVSAVIGIPKSCKAGNSSSKQTGKFSWTSFSFLSFLQASDPEMNDG